MVEGGPELDHGAPRLDTDQLRNASWILTTYETLRNYQHSFGRIKFAVLVFDEAQKIKTPGTLITEAAKAMHAEFTLALTGTPIENRLADLWCIVDTVQPGLLGDLKSFSKQYESPQDDEELQNKLKELKKKLCTPADGVPALMLRRTKEDRLRGLPDKKEHARERMMPTIQSDHYTRAVENAHVAQGRGMMLRVLQNLRDISLHPLRLEDIAAHEYPAASARLEVTFEILDQVKDRDEKALVFLESRDMQEILGILIQRRYNLPHKPLVINGAVKGAERQRRVHEFQNRSGFDVMILSPRAGGVGITLTAANHVIHLSRWWNPAVEDQCSDRVYRIGQTRKVHIYYPLARHPRYGEHSYDLRLSKLLMRKRQLSRDFLLPPAFDDKDVERMFEEMVGFTEGEEDDILLKEIDAMDPLQFEAWVGDRLQRQLGSQYQVNRTPKSHDGGADIIAIPCGRERRPIIVQCKHTQAPGNAIRGAVPDLLRAKCAYQFDNAILIAITNAERFVANEVELADRNAIKLITRCELCAGGWDI